MVSGLVVPWSLEATGGVMKFGRTYLHGRIVRSVTNSNDAARMLGTIPQFNPHTRGPMKRLRAICGDAGPRARGKAAARLCLVVVSVLVLLTGCASIGVNDQRLVSKPNMQFSKSAVYSYSSKILPQIRPGMDVSGGAQASTCTLCR